MPASWVKPSFSRLCTAEYRRTTPGRKTGNLTACRQYCLSSGKNRANARQPGEAQLQPAVHCGVPAHKTQHTEDQNEII